MTQLRVRVLGFSCRTTPLLHLSGSRVPQRSDLDSFRALSALPLHSLLQPSLPTQAPARSRFLILRANGVNALADALFNLGGLTGKGSTHSVVCSGPIAATLAWLARSGMETVFPFATVEF